METSTLTARPGCFLCTPDPKLVYLQLESVITLCGLGPVVPGYSLVATAEHTRSMADAALVVGPSLVTRIEQTRARVEQLLGPCLFTEHGRVAVCDRQAGSDEHCFHAHFLVFPGATELEAISRSYFAKTETYGTVAPALDYARAQQEYFLFSPSQNRYLIMTRPTRMIRQFARYLVSERLGVPERANWRKHPESDAAAAMADRLRTQVRAG